MITPVVGHSTCVLDHQRRLLEARAESLARKVGPRRHRGARETPSADSMDPLTRRGEDVWQALR